MQAILDLYNYTDDYLNINLPILAEPIIKYLHEEFEGDKQKIEIYIKEKIENYIKENFNSPEAKIILAKEYFYQYGKDNLIAYVDNRKEQFLDVGEYYGFSIEELLQNNKIPNILSKKELFQPSPHSLDLAYLKIDTLKGLEQIPEIDSVDNLNLAYNQLNKIESNSFVSLGEKLDYLFLRGNNIKDIDKDAFNGLKNLESLILSDNKISKFENNVFNALPKLKYLLLGGNNIKSLERSFFNALKNLDTLDLGSNQLEIIKDDTFKGLNNLHALILTNNKIKDIESSGFNGLVELRTLDLINNNIDNLSVDVLKPLHQLKKLYYNGYKSPELLEYLKSSGIARHTS